MVTEDGPLRIEVPRDRAGSFEPLLIPEHERRFTGFDDKTVAIYARHDGARDPRVPRGAVRHGGTAGVHQLGNGGDHGRRDGVAIATAGAAIPGAARVKIREDAVVRNKAIYLALGVLPDGARDILGLWIESTEGA